VKKIVLVLAAVLMGATALTSCRDSEKETETIIKEVEVTTEKTTEERGGILERAGEKVDGEVNKEIDNQIDQIGDDN
jgi:hypothetical protein